MGDKKLAGIAAEDFGKVAYGFCKAGIRFIGKHVGVASELLRITYMGAQVSKALGIGIGPIGYNDPDANDYRKFGFPGADEMGNMFQISRDFADEFAARCCSAFARELNSELLSFAAFLEKYRGRISV